MVSSRSISTILHRYGYHICVQIINELPDNYKTFLTYNSNFKAWKLILLLNFLMFHLIPLANIEELVDVRIFPWHFFFLLILVILSMDVTFARLPLPPPPPPYLLNTSEHYRYHITYIITHQDTPLPTYVRLITVKLLRLLRCIIKALCLNLPV